MRDPAIAGWGEFGLVIQAYSKRCLPVLVWLTLLGRELGARIPLRLVKGAYWDSEIKQCQVQGADGYPVYTRKEGTDTSYLACARYLLSEHTRGVIYPQFASHNAHTVTAILALADEARAAGGEERDFEFQRLHGMGDALYDTVIEKYRRNVRIYAPVGAHKDLLPYLVRRLLENGANSSFVHKLVDPRVPVETLIQHPVTQLRQFKTLANDRIPLPQAIFGAGRKNSQGINMNIQNQWNELELAYKPHLTRQWQAAPIVNGEKLSGPAHEVRCPYDLERLVGSVQYASAEQAGKALDVLQAAWPRWSATPVDERAGILERLADLLEAQRGERWRCAPWKPASRCRTVSTRSARRSTSAATTPSRPASAWSARNCAARPASATSCSTKAAASSPASARGTSRWRFSSARSVPRWWPATPCWPSRPSRPA